MRFEEKLYNEMEKAGIYINGSIDWSSNKFQRFDHASRRKGKKDVFVILFNGGASFGDWRESNNWITIWEHSWKEASDQKRKDREDHMLRLKREKEIARQEAIADAELLLSRASSFVSPYHPYIRKKRIIPVGAFQLRSTLVLPIFDITGSLISLQFIKSDGFKQFKKGASPKNGFILLGEKINAEDYLWICEGWATGCSIYEAIGQDNHHVICALSVSNLEPVTYLFRYKFPKAHIIVCADNDAHLEDNIGRRIAKVAAHNSKGEFRVPDFLKFDHSIKNPTDWNDLFCIAGIEEVERQLLNFEI